MSFIDALDCILSFKGTRNTRFYFCEETEYDNDEDRYYFRRHDAAEFYSTDPKDKEYLFKRVKEIFDLDLDELRLDRDDTGIHVLFKPDLTGRVKTPFGYIYEHYGVTIKVGNNEKYIRKEGVTDWEITTTTSRTKTGEKVLNQVEFVSGGITYIKHDGGPKL